MVEYHGSRSNKRKVYVCWSDPANGQIRHSLPRCLRLRNHSPCGFQWGYDGSGPAQLALALLVHATGSNECALAHYRALMSAWIARIKSDSWSVRQEDLIAWVDERVPIGSL
jgi:Family of unknown function (DUF6166)